MPADTTTLAPCPFCGAEPTTKTRSKSPEDGGGYVSFVACYCGGYSANAHQHGDGETAPEAQAAAEIAWNRRAPAPASGEPAAFKYLEPPYTAPVLLDRIARDLLFDVKNRVNALVLLPSSERRESEIRIKQDIADFLAAPPAQEERVPLPKCWCRACRPITFDDMRFVVCPTCGNKRCPKANDHRNTCTDSNEPGQDGSAYPAMVCITAAQKETP